MNHSCIRPEYSAAEIELNRFLKLKTLEAKDYKAIAILTEKGCAYCNGNFSDYLSNLENSDSTLTILASQGVFVDISAFESKKDPVIFLNQSEMNLPLFDSSKFLFLTNGRIDTNLVFSPAKFNSHIKYIDSTL